MKANTTLLIILLIVAAFFLGKFWTETNFLKNQTKTETPTQGTTAVQPTPNTAGPVSQGAKVDIKIDKDDPVKGSDKAKITLVEFADYQCPFCGATAGGNTAMVTRMKSQLASWEPIWPGLQKDFIDSGKVRFVYKDFAFLDNGSPTGESQLSAQAAHCAGEQGKYWEFHDYLYSHQAGENQGAFAKDKLEGFAQTLGLNTTSFSNCLESAKFAKKVKDNTSLGETIGVNGTPSMFINGVMLVDSQGESGAFPYSFIKQKIEEALKK